MIIQLTPGITPHQREAIVETIKQLGYKSTHVTTQNGDYLVGIGKKEMDIRRVGHMEGVADIHRVSDDYKLVSRKWKVNRTAIDLGDGVSIGDGGLSVMAGPCSIESDAQVETTIKHLMSQNVRIMRGGVFKPRSSPYSFRGMGVEGLKMWYELARSSDRKSTRLNSSYVKISYAVFCLKKKKTH